MMSVPRRVDEGARLVREVAERGAVARLLGGVGVALRCPSAGDAPLARDYGDLDLVTDRRSATAVAELLEDGGYRPDREFNAAHGRTRMLFGEPEDDGHVDVFIGTFTMCHVLPLEQRLGVHEQTLPLADLLLTKLQIAQINHKDVIDTVALLLDHDVTSDDEGINLTYLAELLCADWGWWRTVTENVGMMLQHLPGLGLGGDAVGLVEQRAGRILEEVGRRPKTLRWRARARIGERVPWRDEPEEIE
jgi:hypothetical protein